MQNGLRQNKKIIYDLKRREGLPCTLINVTNTVIDTMTGATTRDYTSLDVCRAVFLPESSSRKFVYDLAFIAANKNFTGGGYFDNDTRTLLIDRSKDLGDFIVETSTYVNMKGSNKVYLVKKIHDYEDMASYILELKSHKDFNLDDLNIPDPSPSPSPNYLAMPASSLIDFGINYAINIKNNDPLTYLGWLQFNGTYWSMANQLTSGGGGGPSTRGWRIEASDEGGGLFTLRFLVMDSLQFSGFPLSEVGTFIEASAINLTIGQKYFIAATYDGSILATGINMYINGVEVGVNKVTHGTIVSTIPTANLEMKNSVGIANVSRHYLSLTEYSLAQVNQYLDGGNCPVPDGGIAAPADSYWIFDESDTVITDQKGSVDGTPALIINNDFLEQDWCV